MNYTEKEKCVLIHFIESDFRTTKFHYLHSCAVRKKLGQTDDESQKTMDVVHTETSLTQTVKTDETQELPYVNEDQEKEAIKTPDTHCKVYTPKSLKIKRLTSQVSYLKKKYCHGKNSVRIVDILKIIQPVVHILILLMWAKLKITRPVSFEL
ncbi:uncharacterized protein LOC118200695 [Stegodyphus dumicola]|uniref:uncharacterized protein LOC118200695 n=1 Tax=Stegodyphus dumicola TaxID=202533 RepID=UPI0015B37D5B|nr:uncharacterized protein LOC118200695 [Stegodyphus dumicola]